ncbi:hypothetical protein DYB32_002461 [Aphanomyces invadans]|uniref:Aminotransferase class V domain-containing protein n=1 Tax=Aphanomyces invadans TaxID=157072 RepID=A0A3R6VQE8_9STRA|nr:hypothetical protein DYB32_002461 [Aphanomyces invadans]
MVPGPTSMTATVRQAYAEDVGSPDVELDEFAADYFDLEDSLKRLLSFDGSIAIGSGEGMACLWGAMKSVLCPGDVVVSGANGILNPLTGIGAALRESTSDGLLLVDFVSSSFAVSLNVSAELIDLGLLAPQKALSASMYCIGNCTGNAVLNLHQILEVKYEGYDALAPFYGLSRAVPLYTPYTHNWPAVRATLQACRELEAEGLSSVIQRHALAAAECHKLAADLGLSLFCETLEVTGSACWTLGFVSADITSSLLPQP